MTRFGGLLVAVVTAVSVVVIAGPSAQAVGDEPDVLIAVEACRLSDVSRCDLEDDGLWVKNATTPFGRSVRWRLTLENRSDGPIDDVVLTKVTDGACDAASGPQPSLKPGELRRLACQTSDIVDGSLLVVYLDGRRLDESPVHDRDSARTYVREAVESFEVRVLGCAGSEVTCERGFVAGSEWRDVAEVGPDEDLHWRIELTNTGNRELRDFVVAASNAACSTTHRFVLPGATVATFCSSGSIAVTTPLTVFASAASRGGTSVAGQATGLAVAGSAMLASSLSVCVGGSCTLEQARPTIAANPGDVVTWHYEVRNSGHLSLADLALVHAGDVTCPFAIADTLAPGDTTAATCTTTFAADQSMIVTASAASSRTRVADTATAVVLDG